MPVYPQSTIYSIGVLLRSTAVSMQLKYHCHLITAVGMHTTRQSVAYIRSRTSLNAHTMLLSSSVCLLSAPLTRALSSLSLLAPTPLLLCNRNFSMKNKNICTIDSSYREYSKIRCFKYVVSSLSHLQQPIQLLSDCQRVQKRTQTRFISTTSKLFKQNSGRKDMEVPEGVFCGSVDRFNGVLVDSEKEYDEATDFEKKLQKSLDHWISIKRRAIWFTLRKEHAAWVPHLAKAGFVFHHVDTTSSSLVMYRWLPTHESANIPTFCHTMLGVGGLVVNDNDEVLVVSDRYALIANSWKLPGGYVEPGEEIVNAAIREVKEETGIELGLRMPDSNEFTINDVRLCVGSRRVLDVMDVNTQKNLQMTMKEWQQYYDNPQKDRLLNVISLEFSHTRLDNYVQCPEIVRQIDWVDVVWPKRLKDSQREGTNVLGEMMYPKVQKYCLMSVKNCYTDFHIDFGGTSVWYHILKGSKVFWLIPPTEKNLQLYEKWVLSGKQADVFFGDTVEKCARVYLTAGNTFFIPTGWIHAVYTPTDTLVFGGNFLHSFGIVKQLKTAQVEDATKVPQKFRYPFFTEMLWYVLARYVYTLLGHSHLEGESSVSEEEMSKRGHVHLTHYELFGLKEIVMYLYDLPPQKKNVPELVRDPVALIKDVRTLVERHCKDKPELAITGESVLKPPGQMHPTFQVYDRTVVKQEIKAEIARKNAEIIREQQQLDAANAANAAESIPLEHDIQNKEDTNSKTNIVAITNEADKGSVIVKEYKNEPIENGAQQTATFISPTDSLKYRPPKKMHLANAVAAAAHQANNTVSVIASCSSYNSASTATTTISTGTTVAVSNQTQNNSHAQPLTHNTNAVNTTENSCLSPNDSKLSPNVTGTGQPRRRRTRCKVCAACQRSDCGECSFCLDMVKFGGPGRAKQTCMMRQCLSPMLPVTAQCFVCHLDGWRQVPVSPQTKQLASLEGPSTLMECSVCYEIAHSDCARSLLDGTEDAADAKGVVNEDLPNSWECPSCCRSGKNNDYKPRHFRARQKSSEVRRTSVGGSNIITAGHDHDSNQLPPPIGQYNDFVFTSESEMESCSANAVHWKHVAKRHHHQIEVKTERHYDTSSPGISPHAASDRIKRRKSDDGLSLCSSMQDSIDAGASMDCHVGVGNGGIVSGNNGTQMLRKKNSIRSQLAQQMLNSSTRVLKKPHYVVRPAGHLSTSGSGLSGNHIGGANLALDPTLLKIMFRYLPQETLVTCSSVCKVWSNVSVDPDLWKTMNCAEHKLSASLLTAIVRRQPEHLILDWTQIAKRQLAWVIARLPALKHLSLQNCPIQAVPALHTCLCPPLQILDLSFVRGLNDAAIRDILSPPKDSRPGLADSKTRLRDLKTLKLAGTDITDVALRYITQALPNLIHLDLSSCQRITDAGVAQIGTSPTAIGKLVELNLSACRLVSEFSLEHLAKCEQLIWLDLRHVPLVPTQAVIKFAAESKHDLCVKDIKLVEKRRPQKATQVTTSSSLGGMGSVSSWND